MIQLTDEIRQALAAHPEGPVRLSDPQTQEEYVILRADVYERLRDILDDGPTMRQVGIMVERAMREEDADDPSLESYQKYRKRP